MVAILGNRSSYLKEIIKYLKRLNELNNDCLAWRWHGSKPEPEIEIYEELIQGNGHTLCIAPPDKVIETIKRYMADWGLEDPDE
jgi:hypothetical protein